MNTTEKNANYCEGKKVADCRAILFIKERRDESW